LDNAKYGFGYNRPINRHIVDNLSCLTQLTALCITDIPYNYIGPILALPSLKELHIGIIEFDTDSDSLAWQSHSLTKLTIGQLGDDAIPVRSPFSVCHQNAWSTSTEELGRNGWVEGEGVS